MQFGSIFRSTALSYVFFPKLSMPILNDIILIWFQDEVTLNKYNNYADFKKIARKDLIFLMIILSYQFFVNS